MRLRYFLGQEGYDVIEAKDAVEALGCSPDCGLILSCPT